MAVDAKSVLTFEKHPLVAELELKVSDNEGYFKYLILTLPPEGAF